MWCRCGWCNVVGVVWLLWCGWCCVVGVDVVGDKVEMISVR